MRVRLVSSLERELLVSGLDPEQLQQDFSDWKNGDPDGSYLFGKDGLNTSSNMLRHVHMVPLYVEADQAKWDRAWESNYARRTSDRYLFYADGGLSEGFLLIDILDDPGAHEIWKPTHRKILSTWEDVAEQFIVFGKVP